MYSHFSVLKIKLSQVLTCESVDALYKAIIPITLTENNLMHVKDEIIALAVFCTSYDDGVSRVAESPGDWLDRVKDDLPKEQYQAIQRKIKGLKRRRTAWFSEYHRAVQSAELVQSYSYDNLNSLDLGTKTKLIRLANRAHKLMTPLFTRLHTRYTPAQMKKFITIFSASVKSKGENELLLLCDYFREVERRLQEDKVYARRIKYMPRKVFTNILLKPILGNTNYAVMVTEIEALQLSFNIMGRLPEETERYVDGQVILQCSDFILRYRLTEVRDAYGPRSDDFYEDAFEAQCTKNDVFHELGKYFAKERVLDLQSTLCDHLIPPNEIYLYREEILHFRRNWSIDFLFRQEVIRDPALLLKDEPMARWFRGTIASLLVTRARRLWPGWARGNLGFWCWLGSLIGTVVFIGIKGVDFDYKEKFGESTALVIASLAATGLVAWGVAKIDRWARSVRLSVDNSCRGIVNCWGMLRHHLRK